MTDRRKRSFRCHIDGKTTLPPSRLDDNFYLKAQPKRSQHLRRVKALVDLEHPEASI